MIFKNCLISLIKSFDVTQNGHSGNTKKQTKETIKKGTLFCIKTIWSLILVSFHLSIWSANRKKGQSSKVNFQYLCHAILKSWKFRWVTSGWTAIASKAWSKPTEVNITVSIDFSGPWISHCFPRTLQGLKLFLEENDFPEKVPRRTILTKKSRATVIRVPESNYYAIASLTHIIIILLFLSALRFQPSAAPVVRFIHKISQVCICLS